MAYPTDIEIQEEVSADFLNSIKNKNITELNAGETINGATLPVASFVNPTDGEVYACDGNDNDKSAFVGFAITNGTDGNSIFVQFSGIVGGFSGLTKGVCYYVQDDKTIGVSAGTNTILVGVAVSTTQILINNRKVRQGSMTQFSRLDNGSMGNDDQSVIVGFKPRVLILEITGSAGGGSDNNWQRALLNISGSIQVGLVFDETNTVSIFDGQLESNSDTFLRGYLTVLSLDDYGFTIRVVWSQDSAGSGGRSVSYDVDYIAIE